MIQRAKITIHVRVQEYPFGHSKEDGRNLGVFQSPKKGKKLLKRFSIGKYTKQQIEQIHVGARKSMRQQFKRIAISASEMSNTVVQHEAR